MRHLRLLTHVVEVARTGSIRRAAELLNLTPSAMNRRSNKGVPISASRS